MRKRDRMRQPGRGAMIVQGRQRSWRIQLLYQTKTPRHIQTHAILYSAGQDHSIRRQQVVLIKTSVPSNTTKQRQAVLFTRPPSIHHYTIPPFDPFCYYALTILRCGKKAEERRREYMEGVRDTPINWHGTQDFGKQKQTLCSLKTVFSEATKMTSRVLNTLSPANNVEMLWIPIKP